MLTLAGLLVLGTSVGVRADTNEEVSSCSVQTENEAAYDWFKNLQQSIEQNSGIPAKTEVNEEPSPKPLEGGEPDGQTDIEDALSKFGSEDLIAEPDEEPASSFDMKQPRLGKLRAAARAESNKARSRIIGYRRGKPIIKYYKKNQPRVSKFLCHQAVKDALMATGMTKTRLPYVPAKWAHQKGTLKSEGFENLLETHPEKKFDSKSAPLGAVLVYEGGQNKCRSGSKRISCGHIEIKLNAAEYCSDYCKAIPIDKYLNRKLIGVYVKK